MNMPIENLDCHPEGIQINVLEDREGQEQLPVIPEDDQEPQDGAVIPEDDHQDGTVSSASSNIDSDSVQEDLPEKMPPQNVGMKQEWERGLQDLYDSVNYRHIELDIPNDISSHTVASRLLGKAYELAQQARMINTWAHRQFHNAQKNLAHTTKQLEVAEHQVKKIAAAIEGPRFHAVLCESKGVQIMPNVVEQDEEICRVSMNGSDPVAVIAIPNYSN
ncbi:hypothetical protein HYPSUDRAFT_58591 [Hypholoma sublateritium FD-334 SS-4]|uniref:Uncharacterized protein n=1 Tax=Hypholoma sublateritium (strain FD-334 SS-4) TaxID=945553 RepID=A0A0D2NGK4_HYPSF|nr:hypothetical protein HYPSUDRAFT_58591 [Hypholoma sublateritium FD-334 SS-4]